MKRTLGIDIAGSWVFTPGAAGAGTIAFSGITLTLEQILVINNSTRNETIYSFPSGAKGAASFANNTLTLDANTSTHSASDRLLIYVEVEDELVKTLQCLRMAVHALTRNMGRVDTVGRLVVDANVSSGTLPGVTTVTTVGTVTNQAQHGGVAANDFIPTITRLGGDGLRRNISVT
jgi:hypothetical protein